MNFRFQKLALFCGQARTSDRVVLRLLLILLACAIPTIAQAEYRVFQLAITDGQTGQSRVVVSTLDEIQYPMYHPINPGSAIAIQATWMCWGRSDGFQSYCPNPKTTTNQAPAPQPSTKSTAPKT